MPSASWHREEVRESRGVRGSFLRGLLWLASVPYGWIVGRRNAGFDSGRREIRRVSAPVISVGNLTVGGTGKTPLVAWLAQMLTAEGRRVALVSRGYGAASAGEPNDEARELADRLPDVPHVQNRDRVAAARVALDEHHADVLVLDDAFQHRRLHRDLDIVLLDALDPFGGEHLLPRGLLREPMTSLRRADVVVLTRSDLVEPTRREAIHETAARFAPQALWVEAMVRPTALLWRGNDDDERSLIQRLPLETLSGRRVAAFCALGNPAGFRRTLEGAGLQVAAFREFPDHHRYSDADLRQLDEWAAAQRDVEAVICTHKDWVKFDRKSIGPLPVYALSIELAWRLGEESLRAILRETLAKHEAKT